MRCRAELLLRAANNVHDDHEINHTEQQNSYTLLFVDIYKYMMTITNEREIQLEWIQLSPS